jgi:HK97 family phage major capsid protein
MNEKDELYLSAFKEYLIKGVNQEFLGGPSDHGYNLPQSAMDSIASELRNDSIMRQISGGMTTRITSVAVSHARYGAMDLRLHNLTMTPKATQIFLDSIAFDVLDWLGDKIVDIYSPIENKAFISGSGHGCPRGILTYEDIEKRLSLDSKFLATDIMELYYSLDEKYTTNASFIMNGKTIEVARQLKDGNGEHLWNPGLSDGAPDTLMGVPVYKVEDMPISTIAIGDFKAGYYIADSEGLRVARDPFTDRPYVLLRTLKSVGAGVTDFDAIKLLELK